MEIVHLNTATSHFACEVAPEYFCKQWKKASRHNLEKSCAYHLNIMLPHPGLGKNARTFKKVKVFLRITKFKEINLNFKYFLRLCKH